MNRENILKVAAAIEDAARPDATPEIGFNMADFVDASDDFADHSGHNCPTICCIAGWSRHLFHPDRRGARWDGTMDEGADWDVAVADFGLAQPVASTLFLPDWKDGAPPIEEITPAHAVAVLRHLAETGKVDWTVGAPAHAD